jgi:microcystin-dependent protein
MEIDQSDGTEDAEGVHMFPIKTATTRDQISDPKEGQLVIRSDTRAIDVYQGGAWIEFMSWSPGDMKMAAYDDAAAVGWLKADGASYLKVDYPDLFGVIDIDFGSADSDHFNVPKMDSRIPIGIDSGDADYDAIAKEDGAKTRTIIEANLPPHVHDEGSLVTDDPGDHGHDINLSNKAALGNWGVNSAQTRELDDSATEFHPAEEVVVDNGAHTHTVTGDTGVGDGVSTAIDIMPPVITMQWYIKL